MSLDVSVGYGVKSLVFTPGRGAASCWVAMDFRPP